MEKYLSVLTLGLVSINLVAFSPIVAKGDVDNTVVTESICVLGECSTVYKETETYRACNKILIETELSALGTSMTSNLEEAVASL